MMMPAGEAVVGSEVVPAVEVGAAETVLVEVVDLADLVAAVVDLMAVAQEEVGNANTTKSLSQQDLLGHLLFHPDDDIPGFLAGLNISISLYQLT